MKIKILILFLLTSLNVSSQTPRGFKFEFKDGTVVYGKVFSDQFYRPNNKGISIQVDGKIYVHHYPTREYTRTYAPPYLDIEYNPYGIPTCSPTRISFMHFKNSTLKSLYNSYSKMTNRENIVISKSILGAMHMKGPRTKWEKADPEKTKLWHTNVQNEFGLFIRYKHMIYGGDLNEGKYINK